MKTVILSDILGDQRLKFLKGSWAVGDFRLLPLCGQDLGAGEFPELSLRDDGWVLGNGCDGCWSPCYRNCDR